jgi:pimeloyl-ACP methyl ester carboxylesterase
LIENWIDETESAKDRMLPVGMEEAAAKRMGAVITTLPTCHMVILQEPIKVAAVIDEAARKVVANKRLTVSESY